LTQLASMVDLIMVGRLGPWAITSVGLTLQPKFLMMTMFIAMNVGATALVARYKGAGERKKANTVLNQAIFLTLILSAVGSIMGFIFVGPMISCMCASEYACLIGCTVYLHILMVGFIFMAFMSTVTAVLRGIGNSRKSMQYKLIANGVNVIFNYLLING